MSQEKSKKLRAGEKFEFSFNSDGGDIEAKSFEAFYGGDVVQYDIELVSSKEEKSGVYHTFDFASKMPGRYCIIFREENGKKEFYSLDVEVEGD